MSVVWIAFPVTLLLAAGFVVAFVVAARRGQFEDTETSAMRVLLDDEPVERDLKREGGDADEPGGGGAV